MAKSKKIAIVVAAIALIAVIGVVGSTLAFFTDQDTKTNTFTMGNVRGNLLEVDPADTSKGVKIDDGIKFDKVMPGDNLTKEPYMQLLDGSANAYARVAYKWNLDGMTDQQKAMFNEHQPTLVFDEENWVKGKEDNTYYYQTILEAKDGKNKSTNLFSAVKIPTEWDNTMVNASFTLELRGDFIQQENMDGQLVKENDKIVSWGADVDIQKFKDPKAQ